MPLTGTGTPPHLQLYLLRLTVQLTCDSVSLYQSVNMGAKDVLTRKTGVLVGDDVLNLFKYAQQKNFAIPAIVCPIPPGRRC